MPLDIEKKFKLYCENENLEINQSQIEIIKKLQDFFNQSVTKNLCNFFSKKKNKNTLYLHGVVCLGNKMILNIYKFILYLQRI